VPRAVAGFLLPLAVSVFKAALPISITVGALFIARLYGIGLSVADVATLVLSAVLLSFSTPGIPSGSTLMMVPIFLSIGLPAEGVAILIAVDLVPDVFKTIAHVTSDMTAVAVVHRLTSASNGTPPPVAATSP
jgi:proton glutamate symport protein